MAVSTDYKRAFIQSLFWDAEDNAASLYDTLKAATRARISDTKNGKFLLSTGKDGRTVSYALPAAGYSLTPVHVTELCADMLRRYAAATEQLAADGNDTPTDQEILNEILDDLTPRYEEHPDFNAMRQGDGPLTFS